MLELLNEQKLWLEENNIAPNEYEILDISKTEALKKKWISVFIPHVKNYEILHRCPVCSSEDKRSYNWHAFSYNLVEAKEVNKNFFKEKLADYNKKLCLIWEECNSHGLGINSEIIRRCKWTNTDIYIFDDTLTWTFVVTHEEWYYYKEL